MTEQMIYWGLMGWDPETLMQMRHGLWFAKHWMLYGTVLLPILWWIRYRSLGNPLALLILWIVICDVTILVLIDLDMSNKLMGALYAPVTLVLFSEAIAPLVRDTRLKRVVKTLGYSIMVVCVAYFVFFFGIENLLDKEDPLTYPIMISTVVSMLLLLEIDRVIYPAERDDKGLQLYFRAWITYFCMGYMVWGGRFFVRQIEDRYLNAVYYIIFETLMFMAYVFLIVFLIRAMMKYNILQEWKKKI